jgi:hypothetical protein
MSNDYRFPGITEFVPTEGVKPSFVTKVPGLFFVGRVVDALSQIPTADPRNRAAMFEVADEGIVALKAAVTTVEAARADVLKHCPIPAKEATHEPAQHAPAPAEPAAVKTDPNAVTDATHDADRRQEHAKDKGEPPKAGPDDKVDGTPAGAKLGDNLPAREHAPKPVPKNRP